MICVSASAATWARWVTTSTWWRRPSRQGPRPPPSRPCRRSRRRPRRTPASPGASVSTSRRASIVRASSPPLATRDSGSIGNPGLAAMRKVTSSPGVIGANRDVHLGVRHRQRTHHVAHGRRKVRSTRPANCRHVLRRTTFGGNSQRALLFQRGNPLLVALQLCQPLLRLRLKADHVGQRVAVLATQVAQQLSPRADLGEARGILVELFGEGAKIVGRCRPVRPRERAGAT